jgi:parallel beta-helix repeat protein
MRGWSRRGYQVFSPNCCTINENQITNSRFFGIVIQDGNGNTSDNTIAGGQVGIGVVATSVNTVAMLDDEITGTSVAPVKEFACCGFTAKAIVKKD